MLLKKAIEKLENSELKIKKGYLAHAFTVVDKIQQDWQIGYYNEETDKVIVFSIGNTIEEHPEQEVFKKPEDKVKPLNMDNVKLNLEQAIKIADEECGQKYSAEVVSKYICIVQNLGTDLYNLTLVCQSMNLINIRIDANTGEILRSHRQSILGLTKE